jgi:hypothetical protein
MPEANRYTTGTGLDSADIVAGFFPALQATMETIWAPRVSVLVPSTREVEEFAWLGQVPMPVRWVGGRDEQYLNKYTATIRNYEYEATLPISVPDLRRDKSGQLRQRAGEMGARFATHWNKLAGEWIAAGEAGTKGLAYDGQFYYDTDHNESGTSQTNDLTATEVPSANVATTSTLTVTEAANIVMETIAYQMSLTDDQGEPVNQNPTEVLIITTKPGHFAGIKTALSTNNLGTGSGNNNPLLGWTDFTINVQYVPQRVTAADKLYFFFGGASVGATPLIRTEEAGVSTGIIDERLKNNREVFCAQATRGFGYGMWQRSALVTLS